MMMVVWEWGVGAEGACGLLGGVLDAGVGAGVAGNGCNPGTPDAFAGTSVFCPAGKRYDCPDWISSILTSPTEDSI
jgi:hypothetical protein